MARTFADTLSALSGYFPRDLISPKKFSALKRIASRFPCVMLPGVAFETRLAEDAPTLDLFFCIEKGDRKRLGLPTQLEFDEVLFSHPVWRSILRFCQEWSIPNSALEGSVDRVFFEFDSRKQVSDLPLPAFFLQINRAAYLERSPHNTSERRKAGNALPNWLVDALVLLKQEAISSVTLETLLMCFESVPDDCFVDHAAIMFSRVPDIVRINITNLTEESLYSYLEAIGLKTRIEEVTHSVSALSPYATHMVLALDVADRVSPKIGVEFRLGDSHLSLETQPDWQPFLGLLEERGLCSAKKREALIQWSGRSREIYEQDLYNYMIYRFINLVKLVFEPDTPPIAKGYFSASLRKIS